MTKDPTQIQDSSQIPPPGSQFAGQSVQGLVDVYFGTLAGDVDAQPAAKELLGTAPDTGRLTNADYIYKQVSALYSSVNLPDFQSPSGNNVKAVVFVSGSSQGSYGAFHLQTGNQADFDRIVVDSLNALLKDFPKLADVAGGTGASAFKKMIALLEQNAQNPDGSLNLPADGNPFPNMPNAKQGGLSAGKTVSSRSLAQAALTALDRYWAAVGEKSAAAFGYKPPLPASLVASLDQRVTPFRAPQYDQTLQDEFWKHVYNELPGTGPNTDRLQVITGTNQVPLAVQISGTISATKPEPDGDFHISFQPDDPNFPTNQGAGEAPLEIEIIYAGPVTQPDAKGAKGNFQNPFDISQLGPGTRIQAAGPLIFDRAHGKPTPDGKNVEIGLEIHPLVGMSILSGSPTPPVNPPVPPAPPSPSGQLSGDLDSAQGQANTLGQTLGSLSTLLQKMKGEAPTG